MPPKPKLEYDNTLPPFLQRLKGQLPGVGERSHIQQARPKKELIDHDDDGPTYVDETSNETISKEAFEKMVSGESLEGETNLTSPDGSKDQDQNSVQAKIDETSGEKVDSKSTFGSSAKRKHARVVGGDDEAGNKTTSSNKPENGSTNTASSEPKRTKKPGKKGKKIKLSFDDEEAS